jgi:hypothetical protein
MTRPSVLRLFAALLVVAGFASVAHAQLPVNSDVWKTRCNLLASQSAAIDAGHPPSMLVSATRGVSSHPFLVLAVNRSDAEQHYVSCAMYYMAAMAARNGNGGAKDPSAASDYSVLASAELKDATKQSLTLSERYKRLKFKASNLGGLSSSPAETSAAIDASSTMPLSLIPIVTTAQR